MPLSLSHGVLAFHCGSITTGGVSNIAEPHQGISSCSDSSRTPQISPLLCGKQAFPIQSSSVRAIHSSTGLHEAAGEPGGLPETAGHSYSSISGRPPDTVTLTLLGSSGHIKCDSAPHEPRFFHQQGQEPTYPDPADHSPGDGAQHSEDEGFTNCGKNIEN